MRHVMNFVQSFITNISFPTTLDELYEYVHLFDVEKILGCDFFNLLDDNDKYIGFETEVYERRNACWTAPKWCKNGDIVFFMHSKTANTKIGKLKTELLSQKENISSDYFWTMMNSLIRASKLYKFYGGKIFAIGQVSGQLINESNSNDDCRHWKSSIYAPINSIFLLENPIDISEFNSKIMVSRQSSITSVSGENFKHLKNIIIKKNKITESYFKEAVAEPMPLYMISDDNWLSVVNKHRRSFFLEEQFRTYYVDRFLRYLGDNKTFYRECTCVKKGKAKAFVDNAIKLYGKYLLVEVKLSVAAERNIIGQLSKYCNLSELWLDKSKQIANDMYSDNVLVIDTDKLYLYSNQTCALTPLLDLDNIKNNYDIISLKEIVIKCLRKSTNESGT